MDAFLEAYLNLDQVKAWAETRDPQLVRFASASPEQDEPKSSATIALLSIRRATELKQKGRDVDGELWAASGWLPPSRPFIAPAMAQSFADELGVPIYSALVHKDLQVQWPKLPEALGPPHVFVRAAFPTLRYLESLFRSGALKATANLLGEPKAYELSKADWVGLEIAAGGDLGRLGVWRSRKISGAGEGDFENLRVERDAVMRAFPTEPPVAPQPSATEDEVRSLIQRELEKHGGFFSQENGAGIVRRVFPRFPKKRAMELVKEATRNETRGPRGPRKKLCG